MYLRLAMEMCKKNACERLTGGEEKRVRQPNVQATHVNFLTVAVLYKHSAMMSYGQDNTIWEIVHMPFPEKQGTILLSR